MKPSLEIKSQLEKYKSHIIIVEGKKDTASLKSLGFPRIFEIHKNSISLIGRIEQISDSIGKNEKVCVLTDLDKKGREIYAKIRLIFQERGIKLDSGLRRTSKKSGISHIEGLSSFVDKLE